MVLKMSRSSCAADIFDLQRSQFRLPLASIGESVDGQGQHGYWAASEAWGIKLKKIAPSPCWAAQTLQSMSSQRRGVVARDQPTWLTCFFYSVLS